MIRNFTREDSDEWLRMRVALWPDCSDEMHRLEIAEQSEGSDVAVLVYARSDGRLGGFIELSVRDRVDGSMSRQAAYIEGWCVDPDLRGQGIGRQLVERTEAWACQGGLTELASDAEIQNEHSIQAHHALGFSETFRLVHFLKPVAGRARSS
ncbi:MAG: GNAT family N-acetyltransferase [Verrucomicrobia bacterium]|nr:GNAT family N-acetyltransferase [Verrucomicrobiota bacterium]